MVIRYIVWDFDGTLVDTYPEVARAVNHALATFGKSTSLERVTQLSCISMDFCMLELSKEFEISQDILREQFDASYNFEMLKPFPKVIDVCKRFQASGGQNFIVTHRRKPSLHKLLSLHEMRSYFTDIVAGDDGFPHKPDPSAMRYLIDKHKVDVNKLLVVGDRDLDVLAGQAVKAKTCLFSASFPNVSPTMMIQGFDELLTVLEQTVN
jgi:phosphoglycolate phosphatase-like HAD superfamily hydrolase